MADNKQFTDKQLLEVTTTDHLSVEQIQRRSALLQMQSQEVSLDKASVENEKYQSEREQKHRQWLARMADIKANDEEQKRTQALCKHNTGGKDKKGFFDGDGDIYGACIDKETLPTGEIYAMCFRCQREWHHPRWVMRWYAGHSERQLSCTEAVMLGLMPLAEYFQMEAEFRKAMGAKAKTFETNSGELPGSIRFGIPLLMQRMDREKAEFQKYLEKLPEKELRAAQMQAATIQ